MTICSIFLSVPSRPPAPWRDLSLCSSGLGCSFQPADQWVEVYLQVFEVFRMRKRLRRFRGPPTGKPRGPLLGPRLFVDEGYRCMRLGMHGYDGRYVEPVDHVGVSDL